MASLPHETIVAHNRWYKITITQRWFEIPPILIPGLVKVLEEALGCGHPGPLYQSIEPVKNSLWMFNSK
jgi:hypothetical protein